MIQHVVLLKPRPELPAAELAALHAALRLLPERIPGILDLQIGPNTSPENLHHGYTTGFIVTFADPAARDAYLPHPAHQLVAPLVQAAATDVLVFDFETGT